MVSFVVVYNIGGLLFVAAGLWYFAPVHPRLRRPWVRRFFERNRIGNWSILAVALLVVVGIGLPAAKGYVPASTRVRSPATLFGMVYVATYFGAVFTLVTWIPSLRLRRQVVPATETDLSEPPTEGPATISATVRTPRDRVNDADPTETVLLQDYRQRLLTPSEIGLDGDEGTELRSVSPFEFEGPAGRVRVDPEGAWFTLYGRYPEECEIADGDRLTAVGTIRVAPDGGYRMDGDEDFLLSTDETTEEVRNRIRRVTYLLPVYGAICLGVAAWTLQAILGL